MRGRPSGLPGWLLLFAFVAVGVASKAVLVSKLPLNSDDAQPALVFYDVVENHNYLLKDWYIVTNNHLLTEFPLYFALGLVMGTAPLALKLGSFVIFSSSVLALSLLALRVSGRGAALIAAAYLFALPLYASETLLHLYSHVSTITLSFLCLLLFARAVERKGLGLPGYALLFIVSFVSVFSDPYFIFTFIVPAVIAYSAMRLTGARPLRLPAEIALLVSLLSPAGLALFAQKAMNAMGLHISKLPADPIEFGRIGEQAKVFLRAVSTVYGVDGGGLAWLAGASGLLLALLSAAGGVLLIKRDKDPARRFIYIYFAAVVCVLGLSFMAKSVVTPRYLTPFLYATGFFFAAVVSGGVIKSRAFRLALLVLFLLSSANSVYQASRFEKPSGGLERLSGQLKASGLTYGYSSFWHSNIITFLTGNAVKVRTVEFTGFNLDPHYWASKGGWYRPSSHEGPTFLMAPDGEAGQGFDRLSPGMVSAMFGRPQRTLRAEGVIIYVWPYNIMRASQPSVDISERTPHSIGRFELAPEGKAMRSKPGERGLLLYGQYWDLAEGPYRARFIVRAEGRPGEEAARVEVQAVDLKASKFEPIVISKPVMGRAEPGWSEYWVDFQSERTPADPRRTYSYEMRVFSTGEGDVSVRGITVEER